MLKSPSRDNHVVVSRSHVLYPMNLDLQRVDLAIHQHLCGVLCAYHHCIPTTVARIVRYVFDAAGENYQHPALLIFIPSAWRIHIRALYGLLVCH